VTSTWRQNWGVTALYVTPTQESGGSFDPPDPQDRRHCLGLGYKRHVGIPAACSGRSGLLLAVGMLNIFDIMFAHYVLAYVATRK